MLDPSNPADSLRNLTFSFLGGGNMACALITGLIAGGVSPTRINVCVRSEESMVRLRGEYGVNITFIICGKLGIHETLAAALKPAKDNGILTQDIYDGWVGAAKNMYGNNATFQRDEAVRSAALAGMTLMLAAQGKGLASCPMIGFDASAVADLFELGTDDVPVMMVTVGRAAQANWSKKPRNPVEQVLSFI